ncbi:MAG TPA: dTDP-4-dehydrorhamnose reductase [Sedimenticola thiotaurini]|uniref:dTDP-4-dehydrorhamnose reductase n=1 Tax=Sedimenticola thiotaurini TaxID=1543721 RepID=A0A831RPC2_9GAMM|nr:dTDP-4-dehydrorhamnose reductase [Sedimenticola thiotaurini]
MKDQRPSILLIGNNGQVGWELQRTLATLGGVMVADQVNTRLALNLADPDSIRSVVREVKPELIVNAAAYTAVDKAEEEPDLAMAVNGTAPGILAEEAKRLNAALVHYSTDYVFDGSADRPYTEEDEPNPINVYGRTKLAGDRAIEAVGGAWLILRTSWVYGARGHNFFLTMLRLARERETLKIVDDQIGSPTWCRMIAESTAQILARAPLRNSRPDLHGQLTGKAGIYNVTCNGETSWYGFARAILDTTQDERRKLTQLLPIPSSDYPVPAPRPGYSVLSGAKLQREFGLEMPGWRQTLELCAG